jgi:hypothetical protein
MVMAEEGQFKKRIRQLIASDPRLQCYVVLLNDVESLVLSQLLERWVDEAKKEFPQFNKKPPENPTNEQMTEFIKYVIDLAADRGDWFLKWFG